ncbi:cytochrome P450 4C1-like [Panulirus ornatus]|uniref:cytochrome P450 4C1-like n=1 Tax=Panulirus ornatus TaxID=150431 RepID=UPI003A878982
MTWVTVNGMTWLREEVLGWRNPGMVTYLAFTTLVALTLVWFFKRQQKVWLINQLPGPAALPIVGNAFDVTTDSIELFKMANTIVQEYGQILRVWIGTTPLIIISKAKLAEVVLNSTRHLDKSHQYDFFHPWLGNTNVFLTSGSTWHSRRKLLTPAFHFKILEEFMDVFNTQSSKLVKKLQRKADGKLFNIFPDITNCTLDIICESAMGCSVNAQDDCESDYVKAVHRIQHLIQQRMIVVWLQPNFLFKLLGYAREQEALLATLHGFTRSIVKTRRKLYNQKKKGTTDTEEDQLLGKRTRLAFLDLLLEYSEDGAVLSDEDIREEVDLFVFAGHDTTTVSTNWCLYLLGSHPEIQAKVHEELDSIFGGSNRPASMADLRQMKYTENCIKESLRLFPSVPYVGRHLKEDIKVGDYHVPAGATVMVFTYAMHRDPEQFPNPEVFDPDRFLPENASKRHPFAYVPFSAGPRNCIGQKFGMMEEKVVLSTILRKFRVESTTPREDLRLLSEIVLRPEGGNFLKLFPRAHGEEDTDVADDGQETSKTRSLGVGK